MRIQWLSGPLAGTEETMPYLAGHLAVLAGRARVLDTLLIQRAEAAEMFADHWIAHSKPVATPETVEAAVQPPAPERAVRDHRGRPRGGRR